MRIVLCSHDGKNYFGGPYEWIKRIGREFRDRGHEVIYLILSDHKASKSAVYRSVTSEGFEAYLKCNHSWHQWTDNTEDRVKWFINKAKKLRPEVFVANAVLPALYASRQLESFKIKCFGVYHTDDSRFLWFRDLFINQDYGPSNIVFVSEYLYHKHVTNSVTAGGKFVIGCGTDISRSQAKYFNNPLKILYVGKLVIAAKQIHKHLDAFERLTRLFEKIQIDIYGDGNERDSVIERCQSLDRVEYKGFVTSDELIELYPNYQVFVLLSDYEGLPVALMEAMGAGVVPVCLDIKSGIPELIQDGQNGCIVKDRDKSLIQSVERLLNDRQIWTYMSENAKRKIYDEYSISKIVDKWMDAISSPNWRIRTKNDFFLPEVHVRLKTQDLRKRSVVGYLKTQYMRFKNKIS